MTTRRISIARCGAISPLGNSWPETWSGLLLGRRATQVPATEIFDFELRTSVNEIPGLNRRLRTVGELTEGSAARLASHALDELLRGVESHTALRLYGGSTHGESDVVMDVTRMSLKGCASDTTRHRSILLDPIPRLLGERPVWNKVPPTWCYSACTSGLFALWMAAMDLSDPLGTPESGAAVVGVDSLSAIECAGFTRIGATSNGLSNPMRVASSGILISEGAASVLLTNDVDVAEICLAGIGVSCEAGHPTHPDPAGRGLRDAINRALNSAGLESNQIAAIYVHGTGTAANDAVEARAVAEIWPGGVPVSSIKGALGHTMGAAGLFNVLAACETCRTGTLAPSTGDGEALHGICLANAPLSIPPGSPVLALAAGFGGSNAAVIVRGGR